MAGHWCYRLAGVDRGLDSSRSAQLHLDFFLVTQPPLPFVINYFVYLFVHPRPCSKLINQICEARKERALVALLPGPV